MIQPKYQTFGKRFLAALFDGILFIPLSILHYYIVDFGQNSFILLSLVLQTIVWTLYLVIGHGKYGQTVGKKVMGIIVLDLDEINHIGFKRAFLRESVWFSITVVTYAYSFFSNHPITGDLGQGFSTEDYLGFISIGWLVVELVSMSFNSKRRAIHDLMARSVVVDMREWSKSRPE
jgi:uncharacterized RDD family membrane protein YckC